MLIKTRTKLVELEERLARLEASQAPAVVETELVEEVAADSPDVPKQAE